MVRSWSEVGQKPVRSWSEVGQKSVRSWSNVFLGGNSVSSVVTDRSLTLKQYFVHAAVCAFRDVFVEGIGLAFRAH